MKVLVTGAAGFIGSTASAALLDRGDTVIGIDNLNDYYDPTLKDARLARLTPRNGFSFRKLDICDRDGLAALVADEPDIDAVIHLAAQAGVRYSLTNPFAYTHSNVEGHLSMLEAARQMPALKHFVYASSSSVYGGNTKFPFSVEDSVDQPVSLYAATKKACELISHAYAHIYRIPQTGIRFFTVYGPWGRPDMAAFLFTRAILSGEPIKVFNNGNMERDFTYIDDAVAGLISALDRPPPDDGAPPARVYNIGNDRPEHLLRFIDVLEKAIGKSAIRQLEPMQDGDVPRTAADIEASRRDLGFSPSTSIDVGLRRFVDWFKDYYRIEMT